MQITKNFHLSEFLHKGLSPSDLSSVQMENIKQLAAELEKIRAALNRPLVINSGVRTKAKNEAVGGKANSQHLTGKAVDLQITNAEQKKLKLQQTWRGGYGRGNNWCHLDIGAKRRWSY